MPEPLKNMLNAESIRQFAMAIKTAYDAFSEEEFVKAVMTDPWDNLELKARGRRITTTLGKYLLQDYSEAIGVLEKALPGCDGFFRMILPDFVEVYGLDDEYWDLSIRALELFTIGSSSEMAVRPFIIKHEKRMMAQMYAWAKHENEHVRRLSSEGCRPALPWAIALNGFKKDPSPILPILEQLKTDPSLYVRTSVANNLNDISKTHADLVIRLAKDWYGKHEYTDWIVKHGCRTLLKKGNRDALAIFGFEEDTPVEVEDFTLETTSVSLGEDIVFSFFVKVAAASKVRLEYGIDYVKSGGKRSRKIFQISESILKKNEKKRYSKKHSFANVSTRKHYIGTHAITLIVNGLERGTLDFELKV